jgi:hypothetical protein
MITPKVVRNIKNTKYGNYLTVQNSRISNSIQKPPTKGLHILVICKDTDARLKAFIERTKKSANISVYRDGARKSNIAKLGPKNLVNHIKNQDIVIFCCPYRQFLDIFYLCISFPHISVFLVDTLDAYNNSGFYNTNLYSYRGAYRMLDCYIYMRKRGFELSPKCGNVFDDFVVENASKVVRCKSDKLGYNFKIINALVGKGYVPGYKRLNMGLNGFEFIETDKILDNRFIEWSSAQTLDALRFLIQVQRFCIRNNFIPFDPHIANVMFNFYKPQYIDYGTFYTQGNKKQLYNINRNSIARSILHFCKTNTQVVVSRLDAIRRKLNNSNYLKMLDEFDLAIDSINVAGGSSVWIKYGRETIPNTIKGFAGDFKNAKYETIFKVLGETKPKIVLDLGGNKGYFATLASLHGAKVICVDNIDTVVSLG